MSLRGRSVGINTGNNLQAVGLQALTAKGVSMGLPPDSKELQPPKSKVWVIGTVVFFSATIINFVAFGFAPAALLAPLESIQASASSWVRAGRGGR